MPHHCGYLLCLTGNTWKASSEVFQVSDERTTRSSEKFEKPVNARVISHNFEREVMPE